MVVDPKELKKLIDEERDKILQVMEKKLDDILNESVLKDGCFDVTIVPEVQMGGLYSKMTFSMQDSLLDKYNALGWNAFYELAKGEKQYSWRFKYDLDK